MTEAEMQALCDKAAKRILRIPFSDWPEPGLLAGVLYEEFARHCGLVDETPSTEQAAV